MDTLRNLVLEAGVSAAVLKVIADMLLEMEFQQLAANVLERGEALDAAIKTWLAARALPGCDEEPLQ